MVGALSVVGILYRESHSIKSSSIEFLIDINETDRQLEEWGGVQGAGALHNRERGAEYKFKLMSERLTCESRFCTTKKVSFATAYFTYNRKDLVLSLPRLKQQVPNACAILAGLMAR